MIIIIIIILEFKTLTIIIFSNLLRYLSSAYYLHLHIMQFPKGDVPEWVCNAMEVAGIDISSCCAPFASCQEYDSKNMAEESNEVELLETDIETLKLH